MKNKFFLIAIQVAFISLSMNAYAGHGDGKGKEKRSQKHHKACEYGNPKDNFGKGCSEEWCVAAGCFGLGLFFNDAFSHPHKVWVEGHWGYDPYGWKVWIPGHWSHC